MKRFWTVILGFVVTFAQAQISWKVSADSMKFGQQIRFEIEAKADSATKVVFPSDQSFAPFEVVKRESDTFPGKIKRLWYLTAWDSGRYVIPSLAVKIKDSVYHTDSIPVYVSAVAVDTTKQGLYGYKSVVPYERKPSVRIKNHARYVYWPVFLLILLAVALIFWWRRRKKIMEQRRILSPYEEFLSAVEKLKPGAEANPDDFYVKLTDAFRTYLEKALKIPAKESVSEQLLRLLAEYRFENGERLDEKTIPELRDLFKRADLVKFAKHKPYPPEMSKDLQRIRQSVDRIQKVLDEIEAVKRAEEEARLQQEKRTLRKRRIAGMAVAVVILAALVWAAGHFYGNQLARKTEKWIYGLYQIPEANYWYESAYGAQPSVQVKAPVILESVPAVLSDSLKKATEELAVWKGKAGETYVWVIAADLKPNTQWTADQIRELTKEALEKHKTRVNIKISSENIEGQWIKNDKPFELRGKILNNAGRVRLILTAYPEGSQLWKNLAEKILNLSGLETSENR